MQNEQPIKPVHEHGILVLGIWKWQVAKRETVTAHQVTKPTEYRGAGSAWFEAQGPTQGQRRGSIWDFVECMQSDGGGAGGGGMATPSTPKYLLLSCGRTLLSMGATWGKCVEQING